MSHTPGPWTFSWTLDLGMSEQDDPNGVRVIEGDAGQQLLIGSKYYPSTPDSIEDWQLIAAAPDLLAALRGILEIGKRDMSNEKYDGYFESARAALAKAEGR